MCIPPSLLLLLLPRSRSFSANVFLSSLTASVSSALSKIVPTITGPQRGPAGTRRGASRQRAGIWGRKDTGGWQDEGREGSHPSLPPNPQGNPSSTQSRGSAPQAGGEGHLGGVMRPRPGWGFPLPPQKKGMSPCCHPSLSPPARQHRCAHRMEGGGCIFLDRGGLKMPSPHPSAQVPPPTRDAPPNQSPSAEVSDRTGGVPPA